jgi:hypothetical protein
VTLKCICDGCGKEIDRFECSRVEITIAKNVGTLDGQAYWEWEEIPLHACNQECLAAILEREAERLRA